MSKQELTSKVHELRELKRMKDELESMIEGISDEIKSIMTAEGTDVLNGTDWKVTWKEVTTSRIDGTALKKEFPDVAARFTKTTTYRRFLVA